MDLLKESEITLGLDIMNMYLRILDVYNEYLFYQNQHEFPDVNYNKVKILDSVLVSRIIEDNKNGGLDEEIDILLEDFYSNDIYVLPIWKKEQNRLWAVVITLIEDKTFIQLYDRSRSEYTEQQLDQLNSDVSQDVHDFLERAQSTHGVTYDESKVDGTTHTIDVDSENNMIPAVVQIAENIVCSQDAAQTETVNKVRHKILDRIISLYLLE